MNVVGLQNYVCDQAPMQESAARVASLLQRACRSLKKYEHHENPNNTLMLGSQIT